MDKIKELDLVRLCMIILVIMCHILPPEVRWRTYDYPFYALIAEFFSHHLGGTAVPVFFVISGFLFFRKATVTDSQFYKKQICKRLRSILLPFFVWNIIMIGVVFVKQYLFELFSLQEQDDVLYTEMIERSWFENLWSSPVNLPLWYLRDLMCMVLIASFIRKLLDFNWMVFLSFLFVMYVFDIGIPVAGFSNTALLFFSIGVLCSMKWPVSCNVWWLLVPLLCAIVSLLIDNNTLAEGFYKLFILTFVLFGIFKRSWIKKLYSKVNNEKVRYLAEGVFFVFAIHMIYILPWAKGFLSKMPWAKSNIGLIFNFFAVAFIGYFVSALIFKIFKRYFPKTLGFLMGGRITKTFPETKFQLR